jgi:hypothetical protein
MKNLYVTCHRCTRPVEVGLHGEVECRRCLDEEERKRRRRRVDRAFVLVSVCLCVPLLGAAGWMSWMVWGPEDDDSGVQAVGGWIDDTGNGPASGP